LPIGQHTLQQEISSTKSVDKTVVIDCIYPSACRDYIHWYQLKDGQIRRILYSGISSGTTNNDAGFKSFTVVRKTSNLALKISELKDEHSAVYYCACWVSGGTVVINISTLKTFGSGTKLYVKAPTLFGYLPSKKDEKKSDGHGKQTMLCQASGMFPDLVKFAWKKKDAGKWGDVSEGDVVEQRNDGQEVTVTSMLIVDKDKARNDDYQCTVVHEGKTKELEMKRGNLKKL
uniref:Ig-like domain-containing protein n=1 Tax=Cyprinus carpio TaxID=7962 RepID=A0A8C1Z9Q4_CYPCA